MDKPDPFDGAAHDTGNPFTSVPIEITVCVGKARPMIRDLVQLGDNAILKLDKRVDDLVDLYIGDRLIARGTLEEDADGEQGQLAVRLTEVGDLANGLK